MLNGTASTACLLALSGDTAADVNLGLVGPLALGLVISEALGLSKCRFNGLLHGAWVLLRDILRSNTHEFKTVPAAAAQAPAVT